MRITALFLLLAFALIPVAHGQTFQAPGSFTSDTFTLVDDSCYVTSAPFEIPEFGYYSNGQAVVFRVQNTGRFVTQFRPWRVTVIALEADLAIFVCRSVAGDIVSNCIDFSDNGRWQTNVVDVPGATGTYWVIVAENLLNNSPECGTFQLTAIHQPQYYAPPSTR